jgi:hypothetical protein
MRRVALRSGRGSVFSLPQDPNEHRSQRPVLLAVDQELGEGPCVIQAWLTSARKTSGESAGGT